jgi:hypothetical protein
MYMHIPTAFTQMYIASITGRFSNKQDQQDAADIR